MKGHFMKIFQDNAQYNGVLTVNNIQLTIYFLHIRHTKQNTMEYIDHLLLSY